MWNIVLAVYTVLSFSKQKRIYKNLNMDIRLYAVYKNIMTSKMTLCVFKWKCVVFAICSDVTISGQIQLSDMRFVYINCYTIMVMFCFVNTTHSLLVNLLIDGVLDSCNADM